jgi:hypothetical protein
MRKRKPKRKARLARTEMKRGQTPLKRRTPLVQKKPLKPVSDRRRAAQKANAGKRVYERRGATKVCQNPSCGREFYVPPGEAMRRRFCSRTCMGIVQRKDRTRTCTICGVEFEHPAQRARKTCSTKCRNEAVARAKQAGKNPNYKGAHGHPTRAWRAAKESRCRICRSNRGLTQHHVVYEQHVRKRGGFPWDPDDSLTVCFDCHNGHHHSADRRIHVRHLRYENIRFAVALLGDYAADYFIRYYDGTRGEIEERIANALAAAA